MDKLGTKKQMIVMNSWLSSSGLNVSESVKLLSTAIYLSVLSPSSLPLFFNLCIF